MSAFQGVYEAHRAKAKNLCGAVEEAGGLFAALNMEGWADTTGTMAQKLASDAFKVLVIGEFKRGKSTFINALLGTEVLPAYATPCTAVINEIKYGEAKGARLYFRADVDPRSLSDLPALVRAHASKRVNGQIPPIDVDVDGLDEYVVIPDPSGDQAKSIAQSPYDRVEIRWPLDLCRNGVEIIDSPGLNEHGTRTKVTTDYLSKVDAILFVMSCQALASQSELSVVDNQIRAAGHNSIFFVANRFDEIRERERERLVQYAHKKLSDRTDLGAGGVFFLSALDALDGRLEGDTARVARSGIEGLEARLSHFLTHNRGRLKLMQPINQLLKGISKALNEIIPGQRNMLHRGEVELRQRYEEAKPELAAVETRRGLIVKRINLYRERLRKEVITVVSARQRELAAELPGWLDKDSLREEVSFVTVKPKQRMEAVAREVVEALTARIEQEQVIWQREVLTAVIEKHLCDMNEDASARVEDLLLCLDGAVARLTGVNAGAECEAKELSPLERVLAAAGGFVVGGVGSAFVGGAMGFKEMLKSLGPQIALIVGMIVLGVTNPFILIPALFGGGILQGLLKQDAVTEKSRSEVVEAMAGELREKASEIAETTARSVFEQTEFFVEAIDAGLRKEIQSARDQVEAALASLKKGEAETANRLRTMDETASRFAALDGRLRDIMLELAAG
ncbi:MAG: dynamin family protein [Coriobacteriia bacterium]|nr:dynamin family protein [Coriobacteriia bacterium]